MSIKLINFADLFFSVGMAEPFAWSAGFFLLFVFLMVLGLLINKYSAMLCVFTFGVIAVLIFCFWPETIFTEVGLLAYLGVAPAVQLLTLVLFACWIIFLICISHKGIYGETPIYNFKIYLVFPLFLIYGTGWIIIYSCFLYDPIVDEIIIDLREESKKNYQIERYIGNTILLEDLSLEKANHKMINQSLSYQKPLAGMISDLLPEFDYQLAKPQPILRLNDPYLAEAYQPGHIKKNKQFQLLLSLIDKLEQRRYIQDRSKETRTKLIPILNNISKGGAIDYKNIVDGNTALHYSAAIGDVHITQWLVDNGASCNIMNDDNRTPLECVGANHTKEIRSILERRTNVSRINEVVGFEEAIEKGREDSQGNSEVQSVVDDNGCTSEKRVTERALKKLEPLYKRMARLKCKEVISQAQQRALLDLLDEIKMGADIDVSKSKYYGGTALHYSCGIGSLSITKWLLDNGANPNAETNDGITPLQLVGEDNREAIIQQLKKHGAKE